MVLGEVVEVLGEPLDRSRQVRVLDVGTELEGLHRYVLSERHTDVLEES